ncbi:hypothetical protein Syun_022994 [Stephania yunnanensis]|uniref:Uncharacterized protein n=1 Tax=Stephania yunnanensis TaxID=152371 RepID=A0AAP0FF59_9MAGN
MYTREREREHGEEDEPVGEGRARRPHDRERDGEEDESTPDTSIDEDDVYLEVVPEVKGRVHGLGSQGYHRSISSGGASSSRGPAYGLHELEELQWDHQRLQETLLKERMERQEQMRRDKMERQEETREMQDWLARMEALLMHYLGIRPHVPPTPRTPPSPGTERSGPQSDDHPGHLTTEITPSQSAHPYDHRSGHWISPHRRMFEDQRHFLDDHDEFMEQLMPPPRPLPRQEYVHRSHQRQKVVLLNMQISDRLGLSLICNISATAAACVDFANQQQTMSPEHVTPELNAFANPNVIIEDIVVANAPDEFASINAPDEFRVLIIPTQLINDL